MERPFETFIDADRKEFLDDLATLAGCVPKEITAVEFRRGCVIFEGELNDQEVQRLVELFDQKDDPDPSGETASFKRFARKHSVSKIVGQSNVRITILRAPRSGPAQVVFVHGWTGTPKSLGDMPKYLRRYIRCASLVYQYPTALWQHSPSIQFVARNLDNWMRNNVTGEHIAIIAHSMGGLVARKFVIIQPLRRERLDERIRQMTFVASPHDGAVLASVMSKIPGVRKTQLEELDPNSPFLFDLNEQWGLWHEAHVPAECRVRALFGTADSIVSVNNARGLDSEAVPILGATHENIVSPVNDKSEVVLTIARFLREAGFPPVEAPDEASSNAQAV